MWNNTCAKKPNTVTTQKIPINSCLWLPLFIKTSYVPWLANITSVTFNWEIQLPVQNESQKERERS